MPDVRDVVARLAPEDRAIWNEHRTCMRKCYLSAVAATVKIDGFAHEDDSFLDLIDIRLALLFDRAGWLPASLEKVTGKEEGAVIENELKDAEDALKVNGSQPKTEALVDKVTGWGGNGK